MCINLINYKKDLIAMIKSVVGNVQVFTQYPDANILPAVFFYETSNILRYKFSNSEEASISFTIEIYAKDMITRDNLATNIDDMLLKSKFVRTSLEDADSPNLYGKKLGYSAELKEDKSTGIIKIYNNN